MSFDPFAHLQLDPNSQGYHPLPPLLEDDHAVLRQRQQQQQQDDEQYRHFFGGSLHDSYQKAQYDSFTNPDFSTQPSYDFTPKQHLASGGGGGGGGGHAHHHFPVHQRHTSTSSLYDQVPDGSTAVYGNPLQSPATYNPSAFSPVQSPNQMDFGIPLHFDTLPQEVYSAVGGGLPASPVQHPTAPSSFNPLDNARLADSHFSAAQFSASTAFAVPRFASALSESSLRGFASTSAAFSSSRNGGGGGSQHVAGSMGPPPLPNPTGASGIGARNASGGVGSRSEGTPALTENPVYDAYGSSVVALQPAVAPLHLTSRPALTLAPPISRRPSSSSGPAPSPTTLYDPSTLGLPVPPVRPTNYTGLYSSTGLDLLGILARVVNRKNPEIQLGPVDLGATFLVTDPNQEDMPIVYASESFSRLTGYSNEEILGKNCRFLQSPDGNVTAGSKRNFTDDNAVHHLKRFIHAGRESQASLINYYKGGRAFINLVTVIPISWGDVDEQGREKVAYHVGFQVDMVDQPNAIMEKMKSGLYIVNYSLWGAANALSSSNPAGGGGGARIGVEGGGGARIEAMEGVDEPWHEEVAGAVVPVPAGGGVGGVGSRAKKGEAPHVQQEVLEPKSVERVLSMIEEDGAVRTLKDERNKKQFNQLLLDNCDDLVHVVSLKGTLLYVSPSVTKLLQYEPGELVGKTLQSICHPSDIVAVLRELKESGGNTKDETVNLLYRVMRKHSGYIWLEASGKMYLEPGKARKSVILTGRPQRVYRVSWNDLERAGGLGEHEYWAKYSLDGMVLYTTPTVTDVLGYTSEELMGKTIASLDEGGVFLSAIKGMAVSTTPECVSITHRLKGKLATVDVVTYLYPYRAPEEQVSALQDRMYTVIAQTNLQTSELKKRLMAPGKAAAAAAASASPIVHFGIGNRGGDSTGSVTPAAGAATSPQADSPTNTLALPAYRSGSSDGDSSDAGNGTGSGSGSGSGGNSSNGTKSSSSGSFSTIPSTFKSLSKSISDNVFAELETTRGTSWQFELHQLRLVNRKLREERDALERLAARKRKHAAAAGDKGKGKKAPKVSSGMRTCANCGRGGSPEWRSGPTGPKTLCNACGLRWSKARSQSAASSASHSGSSSSVPSRASTTSESPRADLVYGLADHRSPFEHASPAMIPSFMTTGATVAPAGNDGVPKRPPPIPLMGHSFSSTSNATSSSGFASGSMSYYASASSNSDD